MQFQMLLWMNGLFQFLTTTKQEEASNPPLKQQIQLGNVVEPNKIRISGFGGYVGKQAYFNTIRTGVYDTERDRGPQFDITHCCFAATHADQSLVDSGLHPKNTCGQRS